MRRLSEFLNRLPRLFYLSVLIALLLGIVAWIAPQQIAIFVYKTGLVLWAGLVGYWLDRVLFPYARPDSYLDYDWRITRTDLDEYGEDDKADFSIIPEYFWPFIAACIRRALIMIAAVLGMCLGL